MNEQPLLLSRLEVSTQQRCLSQCNLLDIVCALQQLYQSPLPLFFLSSLYSFPIISSCSSVSYGCACAFRYCQSQTCLTSKRQHDFQFTRAINMHVTTYQVVVSSWMSIEAITS